MKRQKDYFQSNYFKQDISSLLGKVGVSGGFDIISLDGGKNNQVFCISTKDQKFLLKAYFAHADDKRDRLGVEFGFSEFAWGNGIRCLPQPYISDKSNLLALYGYIEGCKIDKSELNKKVINSASDFFNKVNKHKQSFLAKKLPIASEACFSMGEHITTLVRRLNGLNEINVSSEIDQQAKDFVQNELLDSWKKVSKELNEKVIEHKINTKEKISKKERCLSPSDFGFHNALLDSSKELYFLDFEYAGWDDPAKMVCDFFSQPQIQVPMKYFDMFVENSFSYLNDSKKHKIRTHLLLPLYRIKWSCIMLNEFKQCGNRRREFSQQNRDIDEEKSRQLKKVKQYFKLGRDLYGKRKIT